MVEKRIQTSLLCLCLIFFQAACAGAGSNPGKDLEAKPQVGFLAPDFSLETTEGTSIQLSDLHGSAVFINFWDTRCMYCRYEMPGIQAMHETYSGQGLVVLSINKKDTPSDVQVYADRLKLTFPILLDSSGKVAEEYLAWDVPYSYFIDKDGIIQSIYIGEMKRSEMQERVQLVLK